jgi:hypothetical protein
MCKEHLLKFRKLDSEKELHCELEIFDDGSAFLEGDDEMVIFEESSDAWEEAIDYLTKRGYTQVDDKSTYTV